MMKSTLFVLSICLAFNAFADCSYKISDMKNSDFPAQEKTLVKETGGKIKLNVDEKSFDKNTYQACDYLGSTNVSLIEYAVTASPEIKKNFGEKVKTVIYKNSAKAKTALVELRKGDLLVTKNFDVDWTSEDSLKSHLDKIFAK